MSTRERTSSGLVEAARVNAEDRQRAVDEVCRQALKGFVGLKVTPYSMAMAEQTLRNALNEAVQAGTYVLPDGLVLDRVELGPDMRIKVFFSRADQVVLQGDAVVNDAALSRAHPEDCVCCCEVKDQLSASSRALALSLQAIDPLLLEQVQTLAKAPPLVMSMSYTTDEEDQATPEGMGGRFEAVAAELSSTDPKLG